MGTLSTAIEKVRLRIKENKVQFFTDADLMSLFNDEVYRAYSLMKNIECKAIINVNEITLVDGTQSYAISDYAGLVSNRVFTDIGDSIPRYSEFDEDRFSYKATATGIDFFNFTDAQEVIVDSWQTVPELTVVADDDIPYEGYWDIALMRAIVVECQEVREHDNSRTSIFAQTTMDDALYSIFERYGVIPRVMRGTLNVPNDSRRK